MNRPLARFLPLFTILLFAVAIPVPAQLVPAAPAQRTALPAANATAEELEKKGDELRALKNYMDSIDYYQAAIKKKPTASLWNKMGIAQLQLSHLPEARKCFEKATKADRKFADAYNNLGVVYYIDKKNKKSIKYYTKAIELREATASFHSNLGSAYFARKDLPKAVAEYERAMQLDPEVFERKSAAGIAAQMSSPEDRAHYAYVLAKMYANAGNFDRALEYLRKAMEDGYKEIDNAYKDQEFANLRKDQRFAELMASKPVALPQ